MAKKFDAKAKAKRQKIIAAVGGVILLAVLAYQVPSVLKIMNKKPPAAAAPAPAPVTPVPGAVPGTPVSTPVPLGGTLSDSDPAPQAGTGQLLSFDRFSSKDPFVQQADTAKAPAAPATPTSTPTPKPEGAGAPTPPPPPAASTPFSSAARTSARISVNGETEQVSAGATFPATDPVFRLMSVTRTTAKVGIAGGSLSTGKSVTLTKGKKVTLMNTADGTRYELVLVSTS